MRVARVFSVTRRNRCTTIWLNVAGHKPLAHLPRWKRRFFHLPSVRWRVWPRPWTQHDAWGPRCRGWHEQCEALALSERLLYPEPVFRPDTKLPVHDEELPALWVFSGDGGPIARATRYGVTEITGLSS